MLTELRLENFKCFGPEVVVPSARLSLLTGINGKGKSTTLQALLLLHQSIARALAGSGSLERIELNGVYVRLGTFREIRHRDRPKGEPVRIGLEFTDPGGLTTSTGLWLKQEDDDARWAGIGGIEVEAFAEDGREPSRRSAASGDAPSLVLDLSHGDELGPASGLDRLNRVHYVSADRLGPQDFFPWSSEAEFSSVGLRGERVAEVLYQAERQQRIVDDVRAREKSETALVSDQASAWLSYVFDGGALRVRSPHSTILTLEMNADGSAHYHSPANLGFGYSYALPIIVAGLVAQPGDILVAENPEAHLHPVAQSRMGELLATVSAAGVQVFVESHSEHILNAFRLAVKEGRVDTGSLSVLYFRRDQVEPIMRIAVEADGRVPHWPDGFFDQRTVDFFRLFGEK